MGSIFPRTLQPEYSNNFNNCPSVPLTHWLHLLIKNQCKNNKMIRSLKIPHVRYLWLTMYITVICFVLKLKILPCGRTKGVLIYFSWFYISPNNSNYSNVKGCWARIIISMTFEMCNISNKIMPPAAKSASMKDAWWWKWCWLLRFLAKTKSSWFIYNHRNINKKYLWFPCY